MNAQLGFLDWLPYTDAAVTKQACGERGDARRTKQSLGIEARTARTNTHA